MKNFKNILLSEIEDLDWIKYQEINPWLEYDAILFDKEPNREDVNKYIEMALNTLNISNRHLWVLEYGEREIDIDNIIYCYKQDSKCYLGMEYGRLSYGKKGKYYENPIKYSKLKKSNIKEENDDLAWIQENWIDGEQLREMLQQTGAKTIPFAEIRGDADLSYTTISDLGQLQSVNGDLYLYGTQISDLGQLQSVGGNLNLYETPISDLGQLQSVGGDLDLRETQISDLGQLQSVGRDLNLYETPISDLGQLQSVGGDLILEGTQISDLGQLQSVGGYLYLRGTQISDLGQLQSVGGDLYLRGTPLAKKLSEGQIRSMVNVQGDIYI